MKYKSLLMALPLLGAMEAALAVDCSSLAEWQAQNVYTKGNSVTYQSVRYTAKWWTQNQNPANNSTTYAVWNKDGNCDATDPVPLVTVTSPSNNASIIIGMPVDLAASVSHPQNVAIERAEFFIDGTLIATDNTAPYSVPWQAQGLGSHQLQVFAVDAAGGRGESSAVNFTVAADDFPPGDPNFKIVGYFPSWQGAVSDIQFDKLTHINYSFLLPNADGTLQPLENLSKMTALVNSAHANNVKVGIAIGGWNGGDDSAFETFAASAQGRATFVREVMAFVELHNLDGVDMDWEYPDPGTSANNYALLMKELSVELRARGKFLTAAVVALGYTGGGVPESVFEDIDFLNLMAYDANNGNHASMQYAKDSIAYWQSRGLSKEKTVLGVPFYARPTWKAYRTLVQENPANACRDTDGSSYYNGIPTIRAKTEYAKLNAGGIMNWELSHDSKGPASLLTAKWEVAKGLTPSYTCQ
ncbi:glycosyl hydrolase family 18 protein [Pseudoalteromonas sp. R3]|uniref:glycosyl hydrolase family 18 protein n=1 Tax=Pseudoalteromonas sp. R3 TaxID=1709477 RepID=UPI0006B63DCB|nr:glycosyl hydrolase family 18 protein [Pseudoalteromonas sp. R3]AZZ98026.1 glycoside hydrolase [Pseudoalteromonas sp. R3]